MSQFIYYINLSFGLAYLMQWEQERKNNNWNENTRMRGDKTQTGETEIDRKRDDCKCQYIIFHIFLSLCLLHSKTSSHLRYFIWQKEIQTVINSTKRLQIHRLVLNYANNSNPCISSLIAINSLLSKNKKINNKRTKSKKVNVCVHIAKAKKRFVFEIVLAICMLIL